MIGVAVIVATVLFILQWALTASHAHLRARLDGLEADINRSVKILQPTSESAFAWREPVVPQAAVPQDVWTDPVPPYEGDLDAEQDKAFVMLLTGSAGDFEVHSHRIDTPPDRVQHAGVRYVFVRSAGNTHHYREI